MKTKKEFLIELIEKNEAEMNDISVDFVGDYMDNDPHYISDDIAECSDSNVPIYYSDKEEWLRNNDKSIEAIEDSVKEFGIDTKDFSFWGMIDQAIYYQNNKLLFADYEKIIENAILFNILAILEENGKENESVDGSFVITVKAMQYDAYSANYWGDVKQFAKGVYDTYVEEI